ncbi:MAG: hypothetical protein JW840_04240 [Candidatus Thermoplasmatota archaeon]|nr:hypothetical protein [Candidatus Thermoplasmatota archaeon]
MKYEKMNKQQLLAAETFSYSYANYADHLRIGNIRFDELMPQDIDILKKAEAEGWNKAKLAKALNTEEEKVDNLIESFNRAKDVVHAPNAAESFRRGVRYSIKYALEEGLSTNKDIEKLVIQICYRAADFAYLLELEQKNISEYSKELRRESDLEDE